MRMGMVEMLLFPTTSSPFFPSSLSPTPPQGGRNTMEVVGRADYRHVPPRQECFRQISVGRLMNYILPWKAPETGACQRADVGWVHSSVPGCFGYLLFCPWPGQVWAVGRAPRRLGLWAPVLPSQQCWILLTVWCCWFISRWELFAVLSSFPDLLVHEIIVFFAEKQPFLVLLGIF